MRIQQDDKEFLLCFFAGQAMQGMLANGDHTDEEGCAYVNGRSEIVKSAASYAKALLQKMESSHE